VLDDNGLIHDSGVTSSTILSATWQGQVLWLGQAASFAKYIPGVSAAARVTSAGIKRTSSFAWKALFKSAKRVAAASAGRA